MEAEESHPQDLREALSITPFDHLIPTQDVAPLLVSASIDTISKSTDLDLIGDEREVNSALKMREMINAEPERFKSALEFLSKDFREYDDKELDDLVFKKPIISNSASKGTNIAELLPPLERSLYESIDPIPQDAIKELKVDLDASEFEESRLSVRKKYDLDDTATLDTHNKTYEKKFKKEYHRMLNNNIPKNSEDSKRKRTEETSDDTEAAESKRPHITTAGISNDERAKQAYDSLMNFLSEMNLGENESVGESSQSENQDSSKVTFSSMMSLYDNFMTIINTSFMHEISIDALIDITKICLNTFQSFNIEDLKLDSNVISQQNGTSSAIVFQSKLDKCFIHIYCARIILLIVNSSRSEKQLHSSDHLNSVIDFLYALLEEVIVDIAKKTADDINESSNIKTTFSNLVTEVVSLFSQITFYIENYEVDEQIVTKLEYMSILVIFAEVNSKAKLSYISLATFENLRIAACETILVIFKSKADQRKFILNELYSNLSRLPVQRNIARQYKLSRGGNVQSISILLIRLIQSYDISKYASIASNAVHTTITNKNEQLSLANNKKLFIDTAISLYHESGQTAEEIANFLVTKLQQSPESQYKQSLELIIEDFLTVMNNPEWPSAEILVNAVMKKFMAAIGEENRSAQFETYAIEMIGKIGIKLLQLKELCENSHSLSLESTTDDILHFNEWFLNTLQYVQIQKLKNGLFVSSFRYLLLKYINYVGTISLAFHGNKNTDQLAALNSDPVDVLNNASSEEFEKSLNSLVSAIVDDSISLNQALNSGLDSSSIKSYTNVISGENLQVLYDSFLRTIRWGLESNKIKTKTKAIKVLSSLLDRDPTLLQSSDIQSAISSKLQDSSPLVRDAVIDLINKYVNSRPDVIEQFHIPICEHLNDHSIQVRKRVIKIAKEMYLHSDKRNVRSQIATKVLRRIEDEDDVIQETAKAYLLDLWFLSLIEAKKEVDESTIGPLCLKRIEVMMDVSSSGSKNYALFENFLISVALNSERSEVREAIIFCIDKTIDFIIDCSDTKLQPQVEKAIRLIALLIQCDGTLLDQNQLTALQPLMIDNDHSSKTTSFYVLQIFKNVLPFMKSLRSEFIDSMQLYLLKHLTKYSVKELHEAMPCVWKLSKMKKDTVKLANAAISCMKMIRPYIDKTKKQGEIFPDSKLQKLLHLVGCFGSYCNFEKHREIFLKSSIGLKQKETVISIIIKFLLYFCGQAFDTTTRNAAITNAILVCGTHPKLFLSDTILNIFDRELDGNDITIKYSIVSGLFDFIRKEDKEVQKKTSESSLSSNSMKLDMATFHGSSSTFINDGICAGIVQRYVSKVLELCLYDSGEFSFLPIQFLQMVIQLGFANPKICMPTILALQSSSNTQIRSISYELHQNVFEKHESLIDSCYIEGFKLATNYRKKLSNDFLQERYFMNRLYSIVKANYSSRKRFINSIKTLISVDSKLKSLDEFEQQRDRIIFVCNNISSLSFASMEEILIVVHHLDKVIISQGIDLAEVIKDESSESKLDEKYTMCVLCQSFIALLSLCMHLKSTYSLSHSVLESFNPKKVDIELRQAPKMYQLSTFVLDRLVEVNYKTPDTIDDVYGKFLEQMHYYSQ